MAYEHVTLEVGSPIARLVLDRPERRNALSLGVMREMLDALEQVAADTTIRVLVIEGHGPAFSPRATTWPRSSPTVTPTRTKRCSGRASR